MPSLVKAHFAICLHYTEEDADALMSPDVTRTGVTACQVQGNKQFNPVYKISTSQ